MNKKIQLHDRAFYEESPALKKQYLKKQIKRWELKWSKHRHGDYYEEICEKIKTLPVETHSQWMICMGTRNNHERDCFRKYLRYHEPSFKIFSLDIGSWPPSEENDNWKKNLTLEKQQSLIRDRAPDYIKDFQKLPESWKNKWDIIFSNSIDHAINPTKTFFHWLGALKENGVLILGFTYGTEPASDDPSTFSKENVEKFFNQTRDVEALDHIFHRAPGSEKYETFFLRKNSK
tara:strand:+ start:48 stop:746 length:699 start_codon:yes stop_codon:yes gene_type:complete